MKAVSLGNSIGYRKESIVYFLFLLTFTMVLRQQCYCPLPTATKALEEEMNDLDSNNDDLYDDDDHVESEREGDFFLRCAFDVLNIDHNLTTVMIALWGKPSYACRSRSTWYIQRWLSLNYQMLRTTFSFIQLYYNERACIHYIFLPVKYYGNASVNKEIYNIVSTSWTNASQHMDVIRVYPWCSST